MSTQYDRGLYKYILDYWMNTFIKLEHDILTPQKFIDSPNERIVVSEYLKHINDLNELRKNIYRGAKIEYLIENLDQVLISKLGTRDHESLTSSIKECFDDRSGVHDKLTYFTLSYICTIFCLLEDNPAPMTKSDALDFTKEIRSIGEALEISNYEYIIETFIEILKKLSDFEKKYENEYDFSLCNSDIKNLYNIADFNDLSDREIKELTGEELDIAKYTPPFNIFETLNRRSSFVDFLIDNVYYYMVKNKCTDIIGLERSGIPLASLVAYKFRVNLHLMRTVPEIKLLPQLSTQSYSVLFDDIAVTGINLKLSFDYLQKNFQEHIKELKRLVLIKDKEISNVDTLFDSKKKFDEGIVEISKFPLKKLTKRYQDDSIINGDDLRVQIKKNCVKGNFWCSEYTYCNKLFASICKELIKNMESFDKRKGIIVSTSTFGLPFASVISYELKMPLYLFSRRPNLLMNFSARSKRNLQADLKAGRTNVYFVDDISMSGTTEDIAEEKVNEIAEKIGVEVEFNKFVIAFIGERKPEKLSYIVDRSYLLKDCGNQEIVCGSDDEDR